MGRLHLIRVPRNHYFRTRCREISMIMAHFTEKHFKENPYFKGKRLDYIGRHLQIPCSK